MLSHTIIELIQEAQKLALEHYGISNILQPGIIKELMIADILGHRLVPQKDLPDAVDEKGNYYEYLASINRRNTKTNLGGSFQIDRVTSQNLTRITRNAAFYFAFFSDHLSIEEIWRVETQTVLQEVSRQLELCRNDIAHINFLTKWVKGYGTKVFPDK
jgi:Restriction endonuclease PvuII